MTIGIDLGTTNTVLALRRGDRTVMIPDDRGRVLLPSAVALLPGGETTVGWDALAWAEDHPEDAILSVKRLMGTDRTLALPNGHLTPVEVSAAILRKAAAMAAAYLGEPVREAVVTVPAYFGARQREDTIAAARLAGLRVLRILSEPTAAALAFGLADERPQTIVVWDLGGGTFDVSVLRMGYGVSQVVAVAGDNLLGGDDWDRALAAWIAEEFERNGTGAVRWTDPENRYRLLRLAEATRRRLSAVPEVDLDLGAGGAGNGGPGIVRRGLHPARRSGNSPGDRDGSPPLHGRLTVTRSRFEALSLPLLERLLRPTRAALADAGITPDQIDRVILAGGATRMPAVRGLAGRVFGSSPDTSLDPDLVVAEGAALQAAILDGIERRYSLVDVVPIAIGIEVEGGAFTPLVGANTPIPARASRIFTNARDGQESVHVHVLQGEAPLAVENTSLAHFELPLPPLPRGVARVEVAFEVDASGILHVEAQDLFEEARRQVELTPVGGCLSWGG